MFHYPTPVVIRRVGPIEFEAENTFEVLKLNAALPFKVGDLGTVSASVNADGRLTVVFASSSCDVLTAKFVVTEYEMLAAATPEVEFVSVARKKRSVPESDDEELSQVAPKKKKNARPLDEEAEFDYDDTSSETALEGDSDFESDFDESDSDYEPEEDSEPSHQPPKRVTRSKAKKVLKPKTKAMLKGMLWCNRQRKYLSKDSFSAKQQKNPNDKTRFSLKDAKHYTLKEKVDLDGEEAVEGEPEMQTFKGRNRRTGGRFEFEQEAELHTNVQYDDAVSGKRRLAAMLKRYVRD
jgi:hypothetical protein